jgi:hypothetical protein
VPDASIPPADRPYLSIVCALGPAQRAEPWLRQARIFLATTAAQAERHRLPVEILLVDYGPSDKPVAMRLGPLPRHAFATVRVLESESAHHWQGERYAQNCGIRRARGAYVLATGTEVIFSEGLMGHLATRPLAERSFYFGLRFDTAPDCPAIDLEHPMDIEAVEGACRRGAYGAGPAIDGVACDGAAAAQSESAWQELARQAGERAELGRQILPIRFSQGNFLLMSRDGWLELGGFPEWNVEDRHLDRIVMAQAHFGGWTKTVFPAACHYFSASRLRDHDVAQDLYIDADGDPRIRVQSPSVRPFGDYHVLSVLNHLKHVYADAPARLPPRIRINGAAWGLRGRELSPDLPSRSIPPQPTIRTS